MFHLRLIEECDVEVGFLFLVLRHFSFFFLISAIEN